MTQPGMAQKPKKASKPIPTLAAVHARMRALADPARAVRLAGFFKTGPGEYAEGDRFLGITVPLTRSVLREFLALSFSDTLKLLQSPWHEERLLALLLLVARMRKADAIEQTKIYEAYIANTCYINNWDLVDLSARDIVGFYLTQRPRTVLDPLLKSTSVWERRIAVVATFYFIGLGQFGDSIRIARSLLGDKHDLIHKAVGWMLREVGKRDRSVLEGFLHAHAAAMPRTMLRYAIEHFPETQRQAYLAQGKSNHGRH